MKIVCAGIGRCVIGIDILRAPGPTLACGLFLAGVVASASTYGAAAPEPPVEAQAAHQVVQPEGLRARLLGDEDSPVRNLDSAIFTELRPVTASEPAVQLPPDQREAD
jgi:hypothetical protein